MRVRVASVDLDERRVEFEPVGRERTRRGAGDRDGRSQRGRYGRNGRRGPPPDAALRRPSGSCIRRADGGGDVARAGAGLRRARGSGVGGAGPGRGSGGVAAGTRREPPALRRALSLRCGVRHCTVHRVKSGQTIERMVGPVPEPIRGWSHGTGRVPSTAGRDARPASRPEAAAQL